MRTAVSLFAGAGGGAHGARLAGYNVTAALDNDKDAWATLNAAGFAALQADTSTFNWATLGTVDVLIGGPPCQPFSAAGKQVGFTDPRDRIPDFIRAVETLYPRVFIMENVRGLTFAKHREYLELVLSSFPEDYHIDYRVLNAADYGVPQTRQRVFVIGRLYTDPVWPVPTHAKEATPSRKTWISAATALGYRDDLPEWAWHRPATTVVGSFNPKVIAGPGYRTKGDPSRQNAAGSFETTHQERAILQGFPHDWPFQGSASSVSKQLGNACPPGLIGQVIAANETFTDLVHPLTFLRAVQDAGPERKGLVSVGEMLSDYTVADYAGKALFLTEDHKTGFALEDGDLQSCFNVGPKGRGAAIVATAQRYGAETLDCIGQHLADWYGQQGFVLDHWEDNWTHGQPPVAYMRRAVAAGRKDAAA